MLKSTTSVMILTALLGFCPAARATALVARPVAAPADDWSKLLADRSPCLVTVKFVMKIEPGSQEQEAEISAVVIDPKGLLLCSNTQTGGFPPLIQARMNGMTATPTNIKVLAGDDTEGVPAKLLARDSEMDLAWIQVDESAGKTFTAVDFTKSVVPGVGDSLLTVSRLGKFFDRAPIIQTTRLGGSTKKPRKLYIPADQAIANDLGMPVFSTDGTIVGFTALQLPEADDVEGGGMGAREYMSAVILPAEDVVKATKRALESAAAGVSPDAKPAGDEKAIEPKPTEPAPK